MRPPEQSSAGGPGNTDRSRLEGFHFNRLPSVAAAMAKPGYDYQKRYYDVRHKPLTVHAVEVKGNERTKAGLLAKVLEPVRVTRPRSVRRKINQLSETRHAMTTITLREADGPSARDKTTRPPASDASPERRVVLSFPRSMR